MLSVAACDKGDYTTRLVWEVLPLSNSGAPPCIGSGWWSTKLAPPQSHGTLIIQKRHLKKRLERPYCQEHVSAVQSTKLKSSSFIKTSFRTTHPNHPTLRNGIESKCPPNWESDVRFGIGCRLRVVRIPSPEDVKSTFLCSKDLIPNCCKEMASTQSF